MLQITSETILLNDETVVQLKYLIDDKIINEDNIYTMKLIKDLDERCSICLKGGSEFLPDFTHLTNICKFCCTPICLKCVTNIDNKINKCLLCKKILIEYDCFK